MYLLFLAAYLILYYIRPNEWVAGIIGFPFLRVVGVFSILLLVYTAFSGRTQKLINGKNEIFYYGFFVSILMSQLSHLYFQGVINSFNVFFPVFIGFLLIVSFLENHFNFKVLIFILILLSCYLSYEGILQYRTGFASGGLEPIYQDIRNSGGELSRVIRIRWYGVFHDPNDLGLALVLVVPFLLNMIMARKLIFPAMVLPFVSLAIYYTNSRGTVLSGLVAVGSYFVIRYRSMKGVFLGSIAVVVLFLFGPSRMSTISAQEGSAHGRIESWYQAYQMFKSQPLFGVGQGMYTNHYYLVAHNSFVHVMAELGFFGLFFFVGMFYLTYHWLWSRIFKGPAETIEVSDLGLISASYAALTGMLCSMFFLSRAYVLIPYLALSMTIGVSRIVDERYVEMKNIELSFVGHLKNTFLFTCLVILGINLVVKLTI